MRIIIGSFMLIFCALCLGGCSGRELEDREFPSVLTVSSDRLEQVQSDRQRESSRWLDFSHTKAVIFHENMLKDREGMEQAIAYLEACPEFARNLLVFVGGEEELELALREEERVGFSLSDYYRNQPEKNGQSAVTLTELWNFWNNKEEEIVLPKVKVSGDTLIPDGSSLRYTFWENG